MTNSEKSVKELQRHRVPAQSDHIKLNMNIGVKNTYKSPVKLEKSNKIQYRVNEKYQNLLIPYY